jgi:tetratricopeptide (TPR) repeat protein
MKNEERAIPYLDFALEFARKYGRRVVHSYGAIGCLEKLLDLVADDGFILINDYGQTKLMQEAEGDFEHQRFSLATFVGVNFPLLQKYFGERREARDERRDEEREVGDQRREGDLSSLAPRLSPLTWNEPFGGEVGGIHARLLSRKPALATVQRFGVCFGRAEYDRIHEPLEKARECVKAGRFELAASLYRQAIARQPGNWVLLGEVAGFLTFSLRDAKAGADMAKLALGLNPACSSDLWCTLGDALYEWGRTAEARSAYQRALKINAADVRARYNLAFVHTRSKNYPAALAVIAEALALDRTGQYRDRLLQKQTEVLQLLTLRQQQEYLLMVNLVSKTESEPQRHRDTEKN